MDVQKDPVRKAGVTIQDLIKEGCWARNVSCTYGGKTLIELAFGRRPPDIIFLENFTPGQLTTTRLAPDETINTLRRLALASYLKVRQAEDLRQDIASSLKFMGGPYHAEDKVWYYQVDKSKIKRGAKAGRWIRAKVIRASPRSSMVVIDLGTRILQVNQSLLR